MSKKEIYVVTRINDRDISFDIDMDLFSTIDGAERFARRLFDIAYDDMTENGDTVTVLEESSNLYCFHNGENSYRCKINVLKKEISVDEEDIFVVTKTLHRSYGIRFNVELFSDRDEADKYAKCCFDSEKENWDWHGRTLFGDSYTLYNEDNNDRLEIDVFKKEFRKDYEQERNFYRDKNRG